MRPMAKYKDDRGWLVWVVFAMLLILPDLIDRFIP